MLQCKMFDNPEEEEINDFLRDNPSIVLDKVAQSSNQVGSSIYTFLTIFFHVEEKHKHNPDPDRKLM